MKRFFVFFTFVSVACSMSSQVLRGDIGLSDPFVMADPVSHNYYMTGTGGGLWQSSDLETWTGPNNVINVENQGWFGTGPQVWAAEIHYVDNKYYYMATFTNGNIQVDAEGHPRRAVHLLSSTLPSGRYSLIPGGDATYLPSEKTTLDGTLFTDTDGKRYLVYCHEWIQNGNGTIEYIELKPDMSGTVGEGVVMTRARDASWNTSPVTDGPYLFRTQTGRLGMIWTSWRGDKYVQGVAYSTTGKISGPWQHEPLPITPDDHGHGMLFRTFDGQLLMSIHSHRNIDLDKQWFERHPVFYVMDDSGDKLRAVMEYKVGIGVNNPSPVVVDNPGFDYGKGGWTCTTGAQNQLIAQNQTGKITGNFFESWDEKSYTGEIYQELSVPNGTYQFSAAAFRSQVISGGQQDAEAVCLFANESTCLVNSTSPLNYKITVYVNDGKLRFGIRSEKKNYRWMGIDNVSVNYYGESRLTSEEIDNATRNNSVYLRNKKNGKYLNAGQSWGTQAITTDNPIDFQFVPLKNDKYAIDSRISNGGGNHYAAANGYLDGAVTPFTITKTDDNLLTLTTDGTHFWGATNSKLVSTTLPSTSDAIYWEALTRDDLLSELTEATVESPVDASFLIQCPGFGRNDTRSSAWVASANTENLNISGGNNTNNCAESFHSVFSITQTLTGVPAGTYALTVQGFYRQDEGETEKSPMFFLGNETLEIPLLTGSENSMSDASEAFTAGRYTSQPIKFYYNGVGSLRVGIKGSATSQWVVWDNFKLTYYGNENTTDIEEHSKIYIDTPDNNVCYDLSGRIFGKKLKGEIYIKNGKKYIEK